MLKLNDIMNGEVEIVGYEDKILHALYFVNIGSDSVGRENLVDITNEDFKDSDVMTYPVKAILKNYKNTEVVEELDINLLAVKIDPESILQNESEKLEVINTDRPVVAFFEIGEAKAPIGLPMKVNVNSGKIESVNFIKLDYYELKDDDLGDFVRYLNNVGFRGDYINKYCQLVLDKESLSSIIKANVVSMFMRQPLNAINIIDSNDMYPYVPNVKTLSLLDTLTVGSILETVEKTTQEIRGNNDPVEVPPVVKYLENLDSRMNNDFDEIIYGLEQLLREENGYAKVLDVLQSLTYGKLPNDDLASYDEMVKRLNPVNAYNAKSIADNLEELTTVQDVVETTANSDARVTMYDNGIEALDILFSNKLNDPEYESYINVSKKANMLEVLIYEEIDADTDVDAVDIDSIKETMTKYYISVGVLDSMFENNSTLESSADIIVSKENRYARCKILVPIKESILF